jgi:hypothetical protein
MITLVCAACGKKHEVDCPPPQLGIDLVQPAQSVGYKAILSLRRQSMVIFCSDACLKANTKKNGELRRYLRAPKKCCPSPTCANSLSPPYLEKMHCGHCGAWCDECEEGKR